MDINEAFPYKDKDGKPMFRKGQKEAVEIAERVIKSDSKFLAINGPVGCGKSVIGVTAGRVSPGKVVYFTPQKSLQDQIGAEGWEDVAVLKGYSGYACTMCQESNETKYKCDYDGEDVEMCNNTPKPKYEGANFDGVKKSIAKIFKDVTNKSILSLKTSFADMSDYDEKIDILTDKYKDEFHYMRGLDDDDSRKPNVYKGLPDDVDVDFFVENMVFKSIACTHGAFECPKKSARVLSNFAKISVLSPDIFYYTNKFNPNSKLQEIDTLIVDEAHGMEGVVQRIFSSSISVDMLKVLYGIDLSEIVNMKDKAKAVKVFNKKYVKKLSGLSNTITLLNKFSMLYGISNSTSSKVFATSKLPYVSTFKSAYDPRIKSGGLDPLDMMVEHLFGTESFTGLFGDMVDGEIGDEDYENPRPVITAILKAIRPKMKKLKTNRAGPTPASEGDICDGMIVFDLLHALNRQLSPFISKTESLCNMSDGESTPFLFNVEDGYNKAVMPYDVVKTGLFTDDGMSAVLNTVVINTGAISRMFFYSKAKTVIFMSGTWVYKNSMYRSLGVSQDNTEFHSIPSTFHVSRRPIYLVRDKNLVNFSEKDGRGDYVYTSDNGKKKFVGQLIKMISSIQGGIKKSRGENANVLVHTNSFKISRMIAEVGDFNPDKYVFHGPASEFHYSNENIGPVFPLGKEEFMIQCYNTPDQGKVFISPSITEGVDFKHKLARAQIILKHPMANWGDPYIQAMMGNLDVDGIIPDRDIYNRMSFTTLVQQYGRVMRDEDDWGLTFIIDQKSVFEFGKLFTNARERRLAGIDFMMNGIQHERKGNKVTLKRPKTFELKY